MPTKVYGPSGGGGGVTEAQFLSRNPDTVFISTAGSDSTGNGSIAAPFATVGKAVTYINGLSPTAGTPFVIDMAAGSYAAAYSDVSGADFAPFPIFFRGNGSTITLSTAINNVTFSYPTFRDVNLVVSATASARVVTIGASDRAAQITGGSVTVAGNGALTFATNIKLIADCLITTSASTASVSCSSVASLQIGRVIFTQAGTSGSTIRAASIVDSQFLGAGRIAVQATDFLNNNITALAGFTISNVVRFSGNTVILPEDFALAADTVATGVVTISENDVQLTGNNNASTEVFGFVGMSAATMIFRNNSFNYTGIFGETADGGTVAVIQRRASGGKLVIQGNRIFTSTIVLIDSHPIIDPSRNSLTQNTLLSNNYFETNLAAASGPGDVQAPVSRYARGIFDSSNNTYVLNGTLSTNGTNEQACLLVDSDLSAGTSTVRSVNDAFIGNFRSGAVTGTASCGKAAIIHRDNGTNALASRTVNPTIITNGNEQFAIGGLSTEVLGVITGIRALVVQNAPAGDFATTYADPLVSLGSQRFGDSTSPSAHDTVNYNTSISLPNVAAADPPAKLLFLDGNSRVGASATDAILGAIPTSIPRMVKFTVDYTQLLGSDPTPANISLVTLPAGAVLTGVFVKATTRFHSLADGGMAVSIGDVTNYSLYTAAFDIAQPAGPTVFQATDMFKISSTDPVEIFAQFNIDGDLFANLDSGSLNVFLTYIVLPS